MTDRYWKPKDLYIRCKVCGKGKPKSSYGKGSYRICLDCRKEIFNRRFKK